MKFFTFHFRKEENLRGGSIEVKEKVMADYQGTPSSLTIPG